MKLSYSDRLGKIIRNENLYNVKNAWKRELIADSLKEFAKTCNDQTDLQTVYSSLRYISASSSISYLINIFQSCFESGIKHNDEFFICDDCGSIELLETSYHVERVGQVCESCIDSGNYVFCEVNQEFIREYDSVRVATSDSTHPRNRDHVSISDNEDHWTCISCEDNFSSVRRISSANYHLHVDGNHVCEFCSSDYFCDEDGFLHNEPIEEDNDKKLFSNTHDNWIITPNRKFSNLKFVGLEVETNMTDSRLETAMEYSINENGVSPKDLDSQKNFYCLKEDGSLDNAHGVEVVFHHVPYETLKTHVRKFFQENNSGIKAWDCGSGYGIHVHLERNSLSKETQERILEFFLKDNNREFLKKIARRNPNHYWTFDYSEVSDQPCPITKSKKLIDKNSEKYRAVYVNSKTLEFRMFRSTTKVDAILVYTDFVLCLASYCRRKTSLFYKDFITFALSKEKHFPNLAKTLINIKGEN